MGTRSEGVVGDMGAIWAELRNRPTYREVAAVRRDGPGDARGAIHLPKMERTCVGDAGAEGEHPAAGARAHDVRHGVLPGARRPPSLSSGEFLGLPVS